MTHHELRDALSALNISQVELGRLLDTQDRTVRRWVSGSTPVPGPVAVLVRLWLLRPELVEISRGGAGAAGDATFRQAA